MSGRADLAPPEPIVRAAIPCKSSREGKRGERVHFEAPPSAQVPQGNGALPRVVQRKPQSPRAHPRRAGATGISSASTPSRMATDASPAPSPRKPLAGNAPAPSSPSPAPSPQGAGNTTMFLELGNRTHRRLRLDAILRANRARRPAQRAGRRRFPYRESALLRSSRGQLNPRQEKALLRMFRAGPAGFQGGLSAEKYISLTGASRATTTATSPTSVEKQALTVPENSRAHGITWLNRPYKAVPQNLETARRKGVPRQTFPPKRSSASSRSTNHGTHRSDKLLGITRGNGNLAVRKCQYNYFPQVIEIRPVPAEPRRGIEAVKESRPPLPRNAKAVLDERSIRDD